MKHITPYTILKRLIKISKNTYGIIENYQNVIDAFPDVPKETLFDVCMYLSRMLYIDYDDYDKDNKTFSELIILPDGYNCIQTRRTNTINITLSVVAILVAIIAILVTIIDP